MLWNHKVLALGAFMIMFAKTYGQTHPLNELLLMTKHSSNVTGICRRRLQFTKTTMEIDSVTFVLQANGEWHHGDRILMPIPAPEGVEIADEYLGEIDKVTFEMPTVYGVDVSDNGSRTVVFTHATKDTSLEIGEVSYDVTFDQATDKITMTIKTDDNLDGNDNSGGILNGNDNSGGILDGTGTANPEYEEINMDSTHSGDAIGACLGLFFGIAIICLIAYLLIYLYNKQHGPINFGAYGYFLHAFTFCTLGGAISSGAYSWRLLSKMNDVKADNVKDISWLDTIGYTHKENSLTKVTEGGEKFYGDGYKEIEGEEVFVKTDITDISTLEGDDATTNYFYNAATLDRVDSVAASAIMFFVLLGCFLIGAIFFGLWYCLKGQGKYNLCGKKKPLADGKEKHKNKDDVELEKEKLEREAEDADDVDLSGDVDVAKAEAMSQRALDPAQRKRTQQMLDELQNKARIAERMQKNTGGGGGLLGLNGATPTSNVGEADEELTRREISMLPGHVASPAGDNFDMDSPQLDQQEGLQQNGQIASAKVSINRRLIESSQEFSENNMLYVAATFGAFFLIYGAYKIIMRFKRRNRVTSIPF